MAEAGYLYGAIVILLAAVVSVYLFQRLGLGPVLGYLVAGALIGPSGLALVADGTAIQALAELGVVFLLFMIGLELPIERVRVMPAGIFGLGAAQVAVSGLAIAGVVLAAGGGVDAAIVIGGSLALSSTAIVLRLLSEGGELASRFGRSAFGILIMQDLAVGPLLVVVLALGTSPASLAAALGVGALKAVLAVAAILGVGRFVLRPLFAPVAATRDPDIFAALTLLVVLCASLITRQAGLSMAFGALLAGMLLADTRYRHQVAAEIQPLRGLLLGLFFMSVGMSLDLALLRREAAVIGLLVVALLAGKTALLAGLARLIGLPTGQALNLGLLLSQGGEFAFVLLGAAMGAGVLAAADAQRLVVVVAVTMFLTPLLAILGRRLSSRVERASAVGVDRLPAFAEELANHVVIAGFGRVGSAVARRLAAAGVPFIAVDLDPHRIALAARSGLPVYYGDACRPEVMEALHVDRARTVVVALDNPKAALQLVAMLRYVFPEIDVFARAYDEAHAEELRQAGAIIVVPEPVAIGASLAGSILEAAGGPRKPTP